MRQLLSYSNVPDTKPLPRVGDSVTLTGADLYKVVQVLEAAKEGIYVVISDGSRRLWAFWHNLRLVQ